MDKTQKRSLFARALERCRSLAPWRSPSDAAAATEDRRWRRWTRSRSTGGGVGRQRGGCFTVHVGPSKERFVIRTECIGHPLFRVLLDDAAAAYGFASPGPVELPCDVELFHRLMCEMDQEMAAPPSCGVRLSRSYSTASGGGSRYQLLSPSRLIVAGHLQA